MMQPVRRTPVTRKTKTVSLFHLSSRFLLLKKMI